MVLWGDRLWHASVSYLELLAPRGFRGGRSLWLNWCDPTMHAPVGSSCKRWTGLRFCGKVCILVGFSKPSPCLLRAANPSQNGGMLNVQSDMNPYPVDCVTTVG